MTRSYQINIVTVVIDFFLACRTTSSSCFNSSDTVVHSSPLSCTGHEWSVGYSVSYKQDSSVWLLYEWTGHGLIWLVEATWRLRDLMFRLTQTGSVSLLLLSLKAALCTFFNGWIRAGSGLHVFVQRALVIRWRLGCVSLKLWLWKCGGYETSCCALNVSHCLWPTPHSLQPHYSYSHNNVPRPKTS